MNKFYIIFYFLINSLAWGQTQVIRSLEASASSLTPAGSIPVVTSPGVLGPANGLTASITPTVTTLTVKAGAGQSSTNLQEWQNSSGTVLAKLDPSGFFLAPNGSAANPSVSFSGFPTYGMYFNTSTGVVFAHNGADAFGVRTSAMAYPSTAYIGWTSGSITASLDTSLSRIGAGIVGVGTGAAGSVAGTLQAKSVAIISPVVPATAADACTAGAISWDASYIYVCTASGAWKRSAIATW